jgi:NAD(P)-dependent dehydrogenase (short-subunit alcohol dehydrogenase family)
VKLVQADVLIIGGDSSLAQPLIEARRSFEFSLVSTTRRSETKNSEGIEWAYLDISVPSTVTSFLSRFSYRRFDLIAVFVGAPSKDFSSKSEYIDLHLTRMIGFLDSLIGLLKPDSPSGLGFVSSRAALYPSRDIYYSAVKAGVSAALRSMSLTLPKNQVVFSVAPGLVLGSSMANDMPDDLVGNHWERSGQSLLSVEDFGEEFLDLVQRLEELESGSVIELGTSYK